MLVGVVTERVIIRSFYNRPDEDQLLVTFGLGIVFVETVRFFFGSLSKAIPAPPALVGITPLGFMLYPTYRLALLGIVAVALLVLYIVLYRTRIGMIVRAGIEDRSWSMRSASTSTRYSCWCSASAPWRPVTEVVRPGEVVPHVLPGSNDMIKQFTDRLKIPIETIWLVVSHSSFR